MIVEQLLTIWTRVSFLGEPSDATSPNPWRWTKGDNNTIIFKQPKFTISQIFINRYAARRNIITMTLRSVSISNCMWTDHVTKGRAIASFKSRSSTEFAWTLQAPKSKLTSILHIWWPTRWGVTHSIQFLGQSGLIGFWSETQNGAVNPPRLIKRVCDQHQLIKHF